MHEHDHDQPRPILKLNPLPSRLLKFILVTFLGVSVSISLIAQDSPIPIESTKKEEFRFRGGSAERGQQAFAILNCIQCHTVAKVNLPAPSGKRRIDLTLASELRFVKRYEDLILAITSPRHVINEQYRAILSNAELQGAVEPLMPDLTDHMSAKQLMDLTAFLDEAYTATLPEYGKPIDSE
jgi:hypothetical protein